MDSFLRGHVEAFDAFGAGPSSQERCVEAQCVEVHRSTTSPSVALASRIKKRLAQLVDLASGNKRPQHLCRFEGRFPSGSDHGVPDVEVAYAYDTAGGNIELRLTNRGTTTCRLTVASAYGGDDVRTYTLKPGSSVDDRWVLRETHGWYDLSVTDGAKGGFLRRFAGHVETGRSSISDPAIGVA